MDLAIPRVVCWWTLRGGLKLGLLVETDGFWHFYHTRSSVPFGPRADCRQPGLGVLRGVPASVERIK